MRQCQNIPWHPWTTTCPTHCWILPKSRVCGCWMAWNLRAPTISWFGSYLRRTVKPGSWIKSPVMRKELGKMSRSQLARRKICPHGTWYSTMEVKFIINYHKLSQHIAPAASCASTAARRASTMLPFPLDTAKWTTSKIWNGKNYQSKPKVCTHVINMSSHVSPTKRDCAPHLLRWVSKASHLLVLQRSPNCICMRDGIVMGMAFPNSES